jgi:hypothetical protein
MIAAWRLNERLARHHSRFAGHAVVPLLEHHVRALPSAVRRRIRRLPARTSAPVFQIEAAYDPRVAQVTIVRDLVKSLSRSS